jgi:hypothetical protein
MLLIYTHQVTPRLRYIFKQLLKGYLGVDFNFTNSIPDFVAHNGPKLSYTKKPLGNELYFRSSDILFESGIVDYDINVSQWDGVKIFFQVGENSALPFDIFGASFYLLSRYEEYLPHMRDEHNRFISIEGVAYKNDFHNEPVVDIWLNRLRDLLSEKFDLEIKDKRKFEFESTINVSRLYNFRLKGFVRTVGGIMSDLVFFRLRNIYDRMITMFGLRKDPFDGFSFLLWLQQKYSISMKVFFLVGNYSKFDRNISYHRMSFRSLIKSVGDRSGIGLLPSYYSNYSPANIKLEKERLEEITNFRIYSSRQHYVKLQLPETYRFLLDNEITHDYSMGFADMCGYRAGTAEVFYFYDLDSEIQTPLHVHPFVVNDYAMKNFMGLQAKDALKLIKSYIDNSRKNNTKFSSLFHSDSLGRDEEWEGWRSVYSEMIRYSQDDESKDG